jgi:hypothetical protein
MLMLRIVRPLAGLFALAAFGLSAPAQETSCQLKLADLPQVQEFFGLSIGQTVAEAKTIVPILTMGRTDDFGRSTTSFSPEFAPKLDKKLFTGVRTVSLDFVDSRVALIWVGYSNAFKWRSVDDAMAGLAAELKLPDDWHPKGREQFLVCQDFKIGVSSIAGAPSIRLIDSNAIKIWDERRTARPDEPETTPETTKEP